LKIVERLARFENPIQISTKELIGSGIYDKLDGRAEYSGQTTIFTSMASLVLSERIEPHAPSAFKRFQNFISTANRYVRTCLYLKPFIPALQRELEILGKLLSENAPNAICIGMAYSNSHGSLFAYRHPVHPTWGSRGVTSEMTAFRERLRRLADTQVLFNSTFVCLLR
jgi:DNA repair photolyase